MNAISLWQPHATLIMLGVKPFETRSWRLPKRFVGQRVAIHAAKSMEDLTELAEYLKYRREGGDAYPSFEAMREALLRGGYRRLGDLPCGHILGTIQFQDCFPTATLQNPGMFGDFSPGRFAWAMTDPKPLATPVPYRGERGFFAVPDEIFHAAEDHTLISPVIGKA